LPIIQPGSSYFAAVKGKTQGFDEMQKGAGGKAGTPDISGIPMYFRSYQNNVAFQLLTLAILGIFMHLGDNHKFRGYEDQVKSLSG